MARRSRYHVLCGTCRQGWARGNGSTFDGTLPLGKKYNIAMINWDFIDRQNADAAALGQLGDALHQGGAMIWFREVFRADGNPYRQAEADLIRRLAAMPKGVVQ